jgi:hypothetical protein
MTITKDDLQSALDYAARIIITAEIDPTDKRLVRFGWSESLPSDLNEEALELLELSVQYYQRTVFTGEYLAEDNDPPVHKTGDRLDDIDYYLVYYKQKLIDEIKKSFGLDHLGKKITDDGRMITPFAEVMLQHRKKIKNQTKK